MKRLVLLVSVLGLMNLACKSDEYYSWTEYNGSQTKYCTCSYGIVTCY